MAIAYTAMTVLLIPGSALTIGAGEIIGQLTLAITTGQKMSALVSMIQPYPTQAEVLKHIGDAYMRGKLTPGVKKLFSKWFAWRKR
ncbi:MAG: hypothetical protein MOB07_19975 [Acidobacteria bacterium]|nr:hypothetical protein [Acidobacteriota bacterium]